VRVGGFARRLYGDVAINIMTTSYQKPTVILIVILFVACSGINDHLILFESEYSRELTESEFIDRSYVPVNIMTNEGDDYIDFDIELYQAGCMKFVGDVEVESDTLKLKYWNTTDKVCDELVVYKLKYRVEKSYAKNLPFKLVRE